MPANVSNFNIRDVWKNNMEEEFAKIRNIVENYPYVAMVSFLKLILPFSSLVILNSFQYVQHSWLGYFAECRTQNILFRVKHSFIFTWG